MNIGMGELIILLLLGLAVGIVFLIVKVVKHVARADGRKISCPSCEGPVSRAGYAAWQILVAIFFFPLGLLSFLAGRQPSICGHCGFSFLEGTGPLFSRPSVADQRKDERPHDAMKCPYCAETIKREAVLCRFCGKTLPTLQSAVPAEEEAFDPFKPSSK